MALSVVCLRHQATEESRLGDGLRPTHLGGAAGACTATDAAAAVWTGRGIVGRAQPPLRAGTIAGDAVATRGLDPRTRPPIPCAT